MTSPFESTTDIIQPEDIITTFEDVDGMKAITLWSGERRICDPCWAHGEVARKAAWTGGMDSMLEPNLCRSHRRRFLDGADYDQALEGKGRPRVNDGECALDDCHRLAHSKGLCKGHYLKDYRRGQSLKSAALALQTTETGDQE